MSVSLCLSRACLGTLSVFRVKRGTLTCQRQAFSEPNVIETTAAKGCRKHNVIARVRQKQKRKQRQKQKRNQGGATVAAEGGGATVIDVPPSSRCAPPRLFHRLPSRAILLSHFVSAFARLKEQFVAKTGSGQTQKEIQTLSSRRLSFLVAPILIVVVVAAVVSQVVIWVVFGAHRCEQLLSVCCACPISSRPSDKNIYVSASACVAVTVA